MVDNFENNANLAPLPMLKSQDEGLAIEKDENGLVFAPYSEIVVDMELPDKRAA